MRRALLYSRSYRNAVMALGPVGYWRLGEASGTVARDETGKYDGTYVGSPTLGAAGALSGDANTAVTLDGVNDVVNLPSMSVALPLTIAGWVMSTSADGMFDTGPSTVGTLRHYGGEFGWQDGTRIVLALDGTLTFLAFAFSHDGAYRILDAYVNGAPQPRPAPVLGAATSSWTTPRLGNVNDGGAGWFTGTLDDPFVVPRILSGNEIARLHQIGRGF